MAVMRLAWPRRVFKRVFRWGAFAHYPAAWLAMLLLAACATPLVAPPGGQVTVPALAEAHFRARDGRLLPLRMWLPQEMKTKMETDGKAGNRPGVIPGAMPKAVIAALHGFNDYSTAFETTGAFLARRGMATYAFDQRGFGAAPHAGLWAGVDAMANDARDFADVLRERYPGVPLFLLGESMGAAVIMTAMTTDAPSLSLVVDGIILLAPAVWARETMNQVQVGLLWLAAHTLPAVTLTGRGLHIRASDNNAMLRALSADPLVIKETRVDVLYGLGNLMDAALAAASRLRAPALILYGRRDEVIPVKPVAAMLDRLPGPDGGSDGDVGEVTLGVYDRGFHMLTRDFQGWRVLEDMAAWIEDRAAPLPSGADARARERLAQDE